MKALNKISQILAIVFGVGSLVLFFMPFAQVISNAGLATPVGAQFAFGAKVAIGDATYNLQVSGHVMLVFILTVISALMSGFAFKAKGLRYSSSIFALGTAIYAWVIALSADGRFFDVRPLENAKITNTNFVLFLAIALTVFAVLAIAYLLIDDYLEAKAKGTKTIGQKIVQFLRDNKSEVKKIVWPGPRDVIKNTITVIVMCLVIGALIWLIDFGLGQLIELVLTKGA